MRFINRSRPTDFAAGTELTHPAGVAAVSVASPLGPNRLLDWCEYVRSAPWECGVCGGLIEREVKLWTGSSCGCARLGGSL
jgi:hypothetical protein